MSWVVLQLAEETFMLFAFGPEDLARLAIPIGIGIGVLMILIVPSFRRSFMDSFKKGEEARERLSRTTKPEEGPELRNDEATGKE